MWERRNSFHAAKPQFLSLYLSLPTVFCFHFTAWVCSVKFFHNRLVNFIFTSQRSTESTVNDAPFPRVFFFFPWRGYISKVCGLVYQNPLTNMYIQLESTEFGLQFSSNSKENSYMSCLTTLSSVSDWQSGMHVGNISKCFPHANADYTKHFGRITNCRSRH